MSVIAYSAVVEDYKDEIVSKLKNYNYDYNLDILNPILLERDLKINSIIDSDKKNVIIDVNNFIHLGENQMEKAKLISNVVRRLKGICYDNNISCLILATTYKASAEQVNISGGSSLLYTSDFIVQISMENNEVKYKYLKNRHN